MADWEDDDLEPEVEPATAEGKIIPLECLECESVFFGYWHETICPTCREGSSLLTKIMGTIGDDEAEAEMHEYKCIEYTRGWLQTRIELNVNLPASSWLDELHAVMTKRGMLKPDGQGGWKYDYPECLADYMRLLTVVSSANMSPFHQLCVIVRFWKTEYKFVKLMVRDEGGSLKMIQHCGPWSKWMKWGKDEVEVNFNPFHPVTFQYLQTSNKGFRALIDVWRNVKKDEGGVDALIQKAAEEVFGS